MHACKNVGDPFDANPTCPLEARLDKLDMLEMPESESESLHPLRPTVSTCPFRCTVGGKIVSDEGIFVEDNLV